MTTFVKDLYIKFYNGKVIHLEEVDNYSQYCIKQTEKNIQISIRNCQRATNVELMVIPVDSLFYLYDKNNNFVINFE